MTDTLVVHVNRDGPYQLEAAPGTFETDDTFAVALRNHGQASHVHVQLDDQLSTVASIDGANHFVDAEETYVVPVTVDGDARPIRGRLKLVTGYGKETEYASVRLVDAEESSDDDRRSSEQRGSVDRDRIDASPGETRSLLRDLGDRETTPVLILGGVALLIAALAIATVDGTAVVIGSIAILAGVAVAAYTLFGQGSVLE